LRPGGAVTGSSDPVTVVISRVVRAGREREYEAWVASVGEILKDIEGSEGYTLLRPTHHGGPEYVLVLRFRDYPSLRSWKASPVRQAWIDKLSELTVDTVAWQEQSGLETWFTQPGLPPPTGPPPRWKQAVLTTLGLVPLLLVADILWKVMGVDLAAWARILTLTPVLVALMAWAVMPAITRVFYPWLYPQDW
jgi:uncharacterized protein